MPRPAKPWWDSSKRQWACRHLGRYTPLGIDQAEAVREFHRLKASVPVQPSAVSCRTVGDVLESFLRHVKASKAKGTYDAYRAALKSFRLYIGVLGLDEFGPAMLQAWLDDQPKSIPILLRNGEPKRSKSGVPVVRLVTWSETTRHDNAAAVKMAFRWARRMRLIDEDPLADFRKPPARRREGTIAADDWKLLLARYGPNDPFRDLLEFCRLTGCRPQEVRAIEARHIDGHLVRFGTDESKGKRRPRVIVMPPEAQAITDRLAKKSAAGPIFRNADGAPWTKDSIGRRLRRAKESIGIARLNLGMIRKTWETEALTRVPLALVAELAGHDPATAMKYYAHLSEQVEVLKRAAVAAVQDPKSKVSRKLPARPRRARRRSG